MRALALTQEPVVQILPRRVVGGDVGAFTFRVLNTGVVTVADVEIFEEYFVATDTRELIQPNNIMVTERIKSILQ